MTRDIQFPDRMTEEERKRLDDWVEAELAKEQPFEQGKHDAYTFASRAVLATGRGVLSDAEVEAEMNRSIDLTGQCVGVGVSVTGKTTLFVAIDDVGGCCDLPSPVIGSLNCANCGRLTRDPIGRPLLPRDRSGHSDLPRFNPYSIPRKARPGEVECPYCVKRPIGAKGLRDHCRASHPDKPEAR